MSFILILAAASALQGQSADPYPYPDRAQRALTSCEVAPSQYLANCSFEDWTMGDPDSWSLTTGSSALESNFPVLAGSSSIRLESVEVGGDEEGGGGPIFHYVVLESPCLPAAPGGLVAEAHFVVPEEITIDPGGEIARGEPVGCAVQVVRYPEPGCSGSDESWDSTFSVEPSTWRQTDVTVPSTAHQSARVTVACSRSASFTVYVDEVSLVDVLFADGFESGTTAAWSP